MERRFNPDILIFLSVFSDTCCPSAAIFQREKISRAFIQPENLKRSMQYRCEGLSPALSSLNP